VRRSRSPSPTLSSSQITSVLARLAEASEELRKFQRVNEDEQERSRMRRSNLRRAASQENDPHGSTSSVASAAGSQRGGGRLSRNSSNNGSLIRESRLESSKIKTELVSERSANEIKISEMQSKLNEFEEERVIGSGSTKLPGMKTKLELSWQKEREDQQRLLQETSTLARDLRQTLFEVERERDKERLESKRKLDQIKRATEEEMEEGRKKIAELQCDLLELRDVHAKLRTSNEKLRREVSVKEDCFDT